MLTVILMLVLFVFLIFPHELGHFIAAKAFNVQVNEFAFGMGPTLLKKQGKETLYSIRAVPIGGYCAMEGEDTEDVGDNPRAFNNKKWWQKIIILLAGAAMNVFIAFLALSIVAGVGGSITTKLAGVTDGGPAYNAGIRAGDTIVQVAGEDTDSWYEVVTALDNNMKDGSPLDVTVQRKGERTTYSVVPELNENNEYKIGIEAGITHSPLLAIKNGAISTKELMGALLSTLKELVHSENVMGEVSGPIGMAQVVSETSSYGALYFVYLVAVISLNLAIFNLLPLPALDGGRIIFVIIRLITGKAISDSVEAKVHAIGLAVLLAFAVFVAGNDILKLMGN